VDIQHGTRAVADGLGERPDDRLCQPVERAFHQPTDKIGGGKEDPQQDPACLLRPGCGVSLTEGSTTTLAPPKEQSENLLAIAPKYGIEFRLPAKEK
jgi:hypothetical protein